MKAFSKALLMVTITAAWSLLIGVSGEQCGKQAGGVVCPNGLCCSSAGYCGNTEPYCGPGCQSQCTHVSPPPPFTPPPPPVPHSGDVGSIITPGLFEEMLPYRNDPRCPGHGFYTYDAFLSAADSFVGFGTTGEDPTKRRELAAFFAQTSHETTGGWPTAPGGPYSWGYCYVEEVGKPDGYCVPSTEWPCVPGQKYYGRGPIQLSYNYNYGPAGAAPQIRYDLLSDADMVCRDPIVSFKTAIWFWMTPQGNKPSSHDVITDNWVPSAADIDGKRFPGYGVITNIINGGIECGVGANVKQDDRIGFYKRYCGLLGVDPGSNLDCNDQRPFNKG